MKGDTRDFRSVDVYEDGRSIWTVCTSTGGEFAWGVRHDALDPMRAGEEVAEALTRGGTPSAANVSVEDLDGLYDALDDADGDAWELFGFSADGEFDPRANVPRRHPDQPWYLGDLWMNDRRFAHINFDTISYLRGAFGREAADWMFATWLNERLLEFVDSDLMWNVADRPDYRDERLGARPPASRGDDREP